MFSLLYSKNRLANGCEAGEQEALAGARMRPAGIKGQNSHGEQVESGQQGGLAAGVKCQFLWQTGISGKVLNRVFQEEVPMQR